MRSSVTSDYSSAMSKCPSAVSSDFYSTMSKSTSSVTREYYSAMSKKASMSEAETVDETDHDEGAFELELEREYIVQRFFDCGPIRSYGSLAFLCIYVALLIIYPGVLHTAFISGSFWLIQFALSEYVCRQQGTEHEERSMDMYLDWDFVMVVIHEILQCSNHSISLKDDSHKADVFLIMLAVTFLSTMIQRTSCPRRLLQYGSVVVAPLVALNKPRFGVLKPRNEALAFFLAVALGEAMGYIVDEMQKRQFVSMRKQTRELSRELSRTSKELKLAQKEHFRTARRASHLERLACRGETFFHIFD